MHYRFVTADVFTDRAFGGNPLAVLPDATGLDERTMQSIAREFNLSETVFVLPPEQAAHTRRLRIFTPAAEIPFAGHPTIGTALLLATLGEIDLAGARMEITFEEGAGPVPVTIEAEDGRPRFAWLEAPKPPEFRAAPDPAALAAVVGFAPDDVVTRTGLPQAVSTGLPFVIVELKDRAALGRARLDHAAWQDRLRGHWAEQVYLFTRDAPTGFDFQARMFAPGAGVDEDPATGSATAAFGGWLGTHEVTADGRHDWLVAQGVEMGRPSRLAVAVERRHGTLARVLVGGSAVPVLTGSIEVPEGRVAH